MSKKDAPISKKDLEEVVSNIVSGSAQEVMGAMAEEFKDVRADLNRIENKLDATVDKVDDHEVRLTNLEQTPA